MTKAASSSSSRLFSRAWPIVGAIAWAASMATAIVWVWKYKNTPGVTAQAPDRWPSNVALARAPDRATIVMLVHPKCPCTRASLAELSILMTRLGPRASGYALFMTPADVPEGWERSDTWTRASEIPGIHVLADPQGAMAKKFGATVSGHTVVYDRDGRLVFRGGITPSRGHEGDNDGSDAILAAIGDDRRGPVQQTPTFGCSLSERETLAGR